MKLVEHGDISNQTAHYIYNAVGKYAGSDHQVNEDEFCEAWEAMGGRGPGDDDHGDDHGDDHHDGGLPADAPNCVQAFQYFDKNGNGEITAKEGMAGLRNLVENGAISNQTAHYIFNAVGHYAGSDH
jgi:hypothetical protein